MRISLLGLKIHGRAGKAPFNKRLCPVILHHGVSKQKNVQCLFHNDFF